MLDVILLGSGATMPTPERGLSAAVLRCAGRAILFDCGEGTQTALRRERVSPIRLDLIALSHYHGDHCFGLPGLLQTMNCLRRTEALTVTGPEGLEEAMEPILRLAGPLEFPVRLFPFDEAAVPMTAFHPAWPRHARLERFATAHRVPSRGYVFRLARPAAFLPEKARALGVPVPLWKQILAADPSDPVCLDGRAMTVGSRILRGADLMGRPRKGLSVVVSGDTLPCPALREAAAGADLLIHDATYGDSAQEDEALLWGHSTFAQAAALAREAQVDTLWLTHFSQAMREPADWLAGAQAIFARTVCGFDGLSVTLRYHDDR